MIKRSNTSWHSSGLAAVCGVGEHVIGTGRGPAFLRLLGEALSGSFSKLAVARSASLYVVDIV